MTLGMGRMPASLWTAWLRPVADLILPVTLLRGRSRDSGEEVVVVVAGALPRIAWLIGHVFAAPPAREPLGHVPAWRLARTLRRHGACADFAIARVARMSAHALGFDGDWLPVPDWVGTRLTAPFDLDAIARRSHSVSDDLRRVRRAACIAELSRRAGDLPSFRHDYYLPFIRRRYREDAVPRSPRHLRRRFRRGGILWIARGGTRIAGVLFDLRHRVLDAVALGVREGDAALVHDGAIAACYACLLSHAQATGCHAVDLRGSRPSPSDGVTRYKRKWGAELYDRADVVSTTFVRWNRVTPAVASLLARFPLIFREHGGLSVLGVESGAGAASDLEAMRMAGLRRTILATRGDRRAEALTGEGVSIVPLRDDSTPRALLAAARAGSR